MMSEDDDYMSDNDVPEKVHNRLLGAISHLYKQRRVKAPVRKESSYQVSEFHLTKTGIDEKKKDWVQISELSKVLDKRAGHVKITEQIKSAKTRSRKLPKALEKPQADQAQRSVGYKNLKVDLNKWDSIVYHQRVAEEVNFPLKEPEMLVHRSPTAFLNTFQKPTELELQLAESINADLMKNGEKEEEEPDEFSLSLQEMKERRSLMAKLRAQLSYREAKAAKQKRIKSKTFRKILRKDKIKNQIKEFEELQKTDPEAALKKLEQLEKARAEERASLRHKTTGKWAKNLAVRAKYNKEARVALSEQLTRSRELTQKLKQDSTTDEEADSDNEEKETNKDTNNLWLNKEPNSEVQTFYDKYLKYREQEMAKEKVSEPLSRDGLNLVKNTRENVGSEEVKSLSRSGSNQAKNIRENDVSEKDTKIKLPKKFIKLKQDKLEDESAKSSSPVPSKKSKNKCKNNVSNNNRSSNQAKNIRENDVSEKDTKIKLPKKFIKLKQDKLEDESAKSSSPVPSKKSKNKCKNNVSNNNRKRKMCTKVGTWSVTPVSDNCKLEVNSSKKAKRSNPVEVCVKTNSDSNTFSIQTKAKVDVNVEDMFYDIENKINQKVISKMKNLKESLKTANKNVKQNEISDTEDNNNSSSLEIKKRNLHPDIDEELNENTSNTYTNDNSLKKIIENTATLSKGVTKNLESNKVTTNNIEPNKFFHAKPKHLRTELPGSFADAESNLDDIDEVSKAEEKSMTISEAFACDDVDEEFKREKEEEIKKSEFEDINLELPGWGSWGGPNVETSKRTSKRFIIELPKRMPRKDQNKCNVVINDNADIKIKPHMVTELPFPFTSVKEYEASIRAPIGSTWLPQSAHRKLIAPTVNTKLGAVIQPMTKDQLVKDKTDWK